MTSRGTAVMLLALLGASATVAVAMAAAPSPSKVSARTGFTRPPRTGGPVHTGCRARPLLRCLSTRQLELVALRVDRRGGVRSSRYGDATRYMQALARELVDRAFPRWARSWARCVVGRESGWNPGAVSSSDDYGLAQLHYGLWPVDERLLLRDPGYAARTFAVVAEWGRRVWPWHGGRYAC